MRRNLAVNQAVGVTVPVKEPELLRCISNGNASGAGLRIYVPKARVAEFALLPGQHYRMERLEDGRIRLHRVDAIVHADERKPGTALPEARLRLELTATEARTLEANLATGDRAQRDVLVKIGKQLRRRARRHGFAIPDRTDDHVENLP